MSIRTFICELNLRDLIFFRARIILLTLISILAISENVVAVESKENCIKDILVSTIPIAEKKDLKISPDLVAPHDVHNQELTAQIAKAFANTEESGFEVGRNLDQYASYLHNGEKEAISGGYFVTIPYPLSLGKSLLKLNSSSHVMDLGAGMFGALTELSSKDFLEHAQLTAKEIDRGQSDYLAAAEKFSKTGAPNTTGITMVNFDQKHFIWLPQFKTTKKDLLENPKISPLIGQYFELIPNNELTSKFGKVDLVLDLSGVMAYTLNLPVTLEKLATIMKPGAELWLRDTKVSIILKDGTTVKMQDFIGKVPGFKRITPDGAHEGAFLFERTTEPFQKPNLELVSLITSFPNVTTYRVK